MHQPKKRPMTTDLRTPEPTRRTARPVGMQEMGPGVYEQIRQALMELSLASSSP
jgi:hypothetical protein